MSPDHLKLMCVYIYLDGKSTYLYLAGMDQNKLTSDTELNSKQDQI